MALSAIARVNCLFLGTFLFTTGLSLLFFPDSQAGLRNPVFSSFESAFHLSRPPPEPMPEAQIQTCAILGILSMGLGLAYFITVRNGIIEYVYLTVPVRMFMAIVGFMSWFTMPDRRGVGLVTVMSLDLVPAALLGWHLGSWSGVVPEEVRKTREVKRE